MKQNFIELITVPFQAGESKLFAISGQYFELIDATNPIDVLLSDVNGAQRGVMRGAEASFNLKNTDFATVQLTSSTTQTIRFAYGSGEAGTRRAAGAVSIVGTVPVSGPLTDAQLRASQVPVSIVDRPTNHWRQMAATAANTAINVFTAAANANGAIVVAAQLGDVANTNNVLALIASGSAPANVADGEPILCSLPTSFNTGPSVSFAGSLTVPQYIAPGAGLWFITSAAASANYLRFARWRFL